MIHNLLVEFQKHTYHLPTSKITLFFINISVFKVLKRLHATSNNTFASTVWNLLQEHKVMVPAGFEQATIWLVVIDNSKLIHLYVQPLVQGRSIDSFPEQWLVIEPMVWAPNGLNKLPKMHFKFCFIFIGKLKMTFLTGQSWRLLKSWYSAGGPEQGFRCCFTEGLNKSLVMSVTQADAPTVSFSKSVKSPTHQWLFENFPVQKNHLFKWKYPTKCNWNI